MAKKFTLGNVYQGFDEQAWQVQLEQDLQRIPHLTGLSRKVEGLKLSGLVSKIDSNALINSQQLPSSQTPMRGASDGLRAHRPLNSIYITGAIRHLLNKDVVDQLFLGGPRGVRLDLVGTELKECFSESSGYLLQELLFDPKYAGLDLTLKLDRSFLVQGVELLRLMGKSGHRSTDNLKIAMDPIDMWLEHGELPFDIQVMLSFALEMVKESQKVGLNRSLEVSSVRFHNAGADDPTELGLTLACLVEYLKGAEKSKHSFEDILDQMQIVLAYDSRVYSCVARARAMKALVARVVESLGLKKNRMIPLVGRSSARMLTLYDNWNNVLRLGLAQQAMFMTGADVHESLLFDHRLWQGHNAKQDLAPQMFELSCRVTRNIFELYQRESFLDQVMDPMGGSYFVESLTDKLYDQSWNVFCEIQSQGGLFKALESGEWQKRINEQRESRQEQIHERKKIIAGVNQFVDSEDQLHKVWSRRCDGDSSGPETNSDTLSTYVPLVNALREYKAYQSSIVPLITEEMLDRNSHETLHRVLDSHRETDTIESLPPRYTADCLERLRLAVDFDQEQRFPHILVICDLEGSAFHKIVGEVTGRFEIAGLRVHVAKVDQVESTKSEHNGSWEYVLVSKDHAGLWGKVSEILGECRPYVWGEDITIPEVRVKQIHGKQNLYKVLSKLISRYGGTADV